VRGFLTCSPGNATFNVDKRMTINAGLFMKDMTKTNQRVGLKQVVFWFKPGTQLSRQRELLRRIRRWKPVEYARKVPIKSTLPQDNERILCHLYVREQSDALAVLSRLHKMPEIANADKVTTKVVWRFKHDTPVQRIDDMLRQIAARPDIRHLRQQIESPVFAAVLNDGADMFATVSDFRAMPEIEQAGLLYWISAQYFPIAC
jgi:hypothetical protein